MSDVIIRVQNLYKNYRKQAYRWSLRHDLLSVISEEKKNEQHTDDLWVLQDINFEVTQGEVVGIIGKNGAGKTTLLRILSGITPPTIGTVDVKGQFATLIALGAAFNPELSGKENIYLNTAIFGLTKKQTNLIMDDILEFSELGEFIEMPIKHYSSGMNARLGFSIAIHVLPEIIFIDEVLAVGDAAFQEKCHTRLIQLRDEGRTIVYVSHSTETVRSLCSRTLWLERGRLVMDGHPDEVTRAYETRLHSEAVPMEKQRSASFGDLSRFEELKKQQNPGERGLFGSLQANIIGIAIACVILLVVALTAAPGA